MSAIDDYFANRKTGNLNNYNNFNTSNQSRDDYLKQVIVIKILEEILILEMKIQAG